MDEAYKLKYEKCKRIVVKWEHDFRKTQRRVPSKHDFEDAPNEVRNAYKLYYKLKTQALTQTISIDDTEDDFIDDEPQDNSCNSFNFNDISINNSLNISSAIGDLLDPQKPLNDIKINENVWNDKLLVKKKQEPEPIKKGESNLTKRFSLKMENVIIKPPRNPRKPFVKKISDSDTMSEQQKKIDEIPDLETILMEKSRNKLNIETEKQPKETIEIKNQVDSGWLTRNTSINTVEKSSLIPTQSSLSNTSSFGLSNLNLKNIESTSTSNLTVMNNEVEVKFHTNNDATDDEIVENSEEESEPIVRPSLHISKKRRLSVEVSKSNDKLDQVPIPNTSENLQKIVEDFDGDDSDKDPDFIDEETSPPILKRKRSLVKRSKDGITKVAKKLLNRSVKGKSIEEDIQHEKEEELNFLIDSDIQNITTAPRVSSKELKSTEEILDNYLRSDEIGNQPGKPIKVVDAKTAAKKEALAKKIATGTLNENYVRVNLKKKMFIRGKKVFNFSRYKKGVWKSKKAAALSGPEMDMRGCDGGVLTCHSCGGVGHFAQQCKQKGDNLLPLDAVGEEESTFPTLEEAAQMAGEKRLIVHASKPENIPSTSNEIWKESNDFEMTESDEEIFTELNDKENNDGNIDNPIIIGHKIPDDFLKKSGLLDMTVGSKDEIQPIYSLNDDGTIPKTPKEVFDALKLFGHKNFRNGQEQAVMRVLCGMSTLVTLSTGSGKSLCYQLPAYLYRKKGHCITLVVSPLVSLMEDQVHGIPGFINAQCLHTNQTPKQRDKIMEQIKSGKVEILLVSPEAVVSGEKSTGFGSLLRQLPPIAFACIDEAHCVSQWSHNFRPSYLMICRVLREKLGVKTVLGLTATATLQTRESIVSHLGISDGLAGIISDIPLPDNLILTISKDENRDQALMALLRAERFSRLNSIIIYCTRRDECERIAGLLRTCLQETTESEQSSEPSTSKKRKRKNWSSEAYHAGLPASRRRTIQNAFMSGELRIVVATIAFGMGINKSDIRGVIHYNMPKSFENYVQEVGRAGRDGKEAHCHVFLESKGSDLSELKRHIYSNSIDRHVIRKLLKNVFVPCSCTQQGKRNDENGRFCKGHEVSFSIDSTVQSLDIPEENIATLLCYLELHEDRFIKCLGNAYTKCKIISYGGPKYLKQIAKTCAPLAMAIAMELKKSDQKTELTSIEFDVIEIAAAIGWDSGVVKYQLKQLEWTNVNGSSRRSQISVTFSDLGFRIRSPGDLTDSELDSALDSLSKRTSSQELTQLIQLQIIFNSFESISFKNFNQCSSLDFDVEKSNSLKKLIREYFQSSLPTDVKISEDQNDTSDNEILIDIRQIIVMYPQNNFTGRALARIFHGISSPCYPAVIWGRCKYWRAHMNVNFKRLVVLGNSEVVKMRTIE